MPGGMSGVMTEEVAVTTVEKGLEKPLRSIWGTSILLSMAASARLEPLRPPMSVETNTFTWASPPRMRPVRMLAKS